ncbi:MAG: type II toxin-antitoxin system VapC family toxin [Propionibacteriaceae bacterium]|jgi:predicted nucleic acid-binding protein|nr:type II toxin-antitoxin system VapC family toxin [Propionibacteriaceae bacterium]
MRFLLDTCVISEVRKPLGNPVVSDWLSRQNPRHTAISVISVLEIDIGIRRLRRRDPVAADGLQRWLDDKVLPGFGGRILPVDLACEPYVASFHVPDPAPERDALIAGTALAHGLTVVTRNTADFARTGVPVFNPWP